MTADSPNWFGRNWKWFVPVGCLSLLLLFLIAVAALVYGVFGMMKGSDPYRHAMAAAQAHPAVVQALGTPLHPGLSVTGSIEVSDDDGRADIRFPIRGPRGEGTVYVDAHRVRDQWVYDVLEIDVGQPARIDLRDTPPASAPTR
ncbi:cytochrome c oxidase assembly factor Coa1 family protein [Agrilutibacter solisilvae]|uniref:Cytochrome oxidase complex assembly protein 1 n=1 Tax=Agrilutibacter solisilvae TaxID=2763317 RepID=A0A975ATM3_9GAMM|nr:cytochrome c oxidase assembly factor Coa1 family protein [Lysobacter solisilvae]QSX79150.1 hypothetical protein I8J32_004440 [Lysobacter solisilvae]